MPATPAGYHSGMVWAVPVSLATTQGIEISFSSSRYLDVSVHALTSAAPMDSVQGTRALPRVGFPIRKSPDQRPFSVSPGLIAAVHVLHRLQMPRHPPCALVLLIRTEIKNTNYHYAVIKEQAAVPQGCGPVSRSPARHACRSLKAEQWTPVAHRGMRCGRR